MSLIEIKLWIWTVTFFFNAIWYYYNPKFVKKNHKEKYNFLDYNTYLIVLYIVTLILAPFLFLNIIIGEIKILLVILYKKIQLELKIRKIKDKNARKKLRKKLRQIKP